MGLHPLPGTKDVSSTSSQGVTLPAFSTMRNLGVVPQRLLGPGVTRTIDALTEAHNKVNRHPSQRADAAALRAVYRRGAGSWSKNKHGGTRRRHGMARVRAHLATLATGRRPDGYTADGDLLPFRHPLRKASTKSLAELLAEEGAPDAEVKDLRFDVEGKAFKWDPKKHPRGKDGRWIHLGAEVEAVVDGKTVRGGVVGLGDGTARIRDAAGHEHTVKASDTKTVAAVSDHLADSELRKAQSQAGAAHRAIAASPEHPEQADAVAHFAGAERAILGKRKQRLDEQHAQRTAALGGNRKPADGLAKEGTRVVSPHGPGESMGTDPQGNVIVRHDKEVRPGSRLSSHPASELKPAGEQTHGKMPASRLREGMTISTQRPTQSGDYEPFRGQVRSVKPAGTGGNTLEVTLADGSTARFGKGDPIDVLPSTDKPADPNEHVGADGSTYRRSERRQKLVEGHYVGVVGNGEHAGKFGRVSSSAASGGRRSIAFDDGSRGTVPERELALYDRVGRTAPSPAGMDNGTLHAAHAIARAENHPQAGALADELRNRGVDPQTPHEALAASLPPGPTGEHRDTALALHDQAGELQARIKEGYSGLAEKPTHGHLEVAHGHIVAARDHLLAGREAQAHDSMQAASDELRHGADAAPETSPLHDVATGHDARLNETRDAMVDRQAAGDAVAALPDKGRPEGTGTLDDPVAVGGDLDKAARLLAEGKHVRLEQPDELSTLIGKIHKIVETSKKRGDDAPSYDFCKISVPGTNLFCQQSKGIPRAQMPQLKGTAVEGSYAATKGGAGNEVDIEPEFLKMLEDVGVKATPKRVLASHLKATQSELEGSKVAGMANAITGGNTALREGKIYTTRDGYVIDGHHRWAAMVAVDIQDGKLANPEDNVEMNVVELDTDIGRAIDMTNEFARRMGIQQKGLGAAAEGVGEKKDLEGKFGRGHGRHVRTEGGSRFFHLPVGSPITRAQELAAHARSSGKRDHVAEIVAAAPRGPAPAVSSETTAAIDRELRRHRTSLGPQHFVHPEPASWPAERNLPDRTTEPDPGRGGALGAIAARHGVDPEYVVGRARAAGFTVVRASDKLSNDPLRGHVPAVDEAATAGVVEPSAFSSAFEQAFAGSPYSAHVSHYSTEELGSMTTLLTTDSLSGLAVHDHGDGRVEATALFSAPGTTKGTGLALLRRAIAEHGVNYVEAFGPFLPELYKKLGFEVDGEFPFDESQAPSGWDFGRFGRPHYYTMRLPGKLTDVATKDEGGGWPPMPTGAEIDAVLDGPVPEGSGDAEAQRDAALAVIGGLPEPVDNQGVDRVNSL